MSGGRGAVVVMSNPVVLSTAQVPRVLGVVTSHYHVVAAFNPPVVSTVGQRQTCTANYCTADKLFISTTIVLYFIAKSIPDGSVAEWLACWTQAQNGPFKIAVATLSGNSLRQTVHTHCASVHQAAKLVAVMAAHRRVYDSHHLPADCQEPVSVPEPYAQ